jgi:hypothetical protein
MGTIKQGILGGFSGKVGNVTGTSWKGKAVIKSRPQSVAYPGTGKQVIRTTAMTLIVAFVKPFISQWIKPLWDRFASQMSGYNAFVQKNISFFVAGVVPDLHDLIMTSGSMLAQPFEATNPQAGNSVTLTWSNATINDPLALDTDVAYGVVFKSDGTFIGADFGDTRGDESLTITCPGEVLADGTYVVFLAFKALNGTRISNSSYDDLVVS